MPNKYLYKREVRHTGLNKYKIVKASSNYELNQKVEFLKAQWNEQWSKKCEMQRKKEEREKKIKSDEEAINYANVTTENAETIQKKLDEILIDQLNPKPLDINNFKDFSKYSVECPKEPELITIPIEPKRTDLKYNPPVPFFTKIIKNKYSKFIHENYLKFQDDYSKWLEEKAKIELKNYELDKTFNEAKTQWEKEKEVFMNKQQECNLKVDKLFEDYNNGEVDAIVKYYKTVINSIKIPFEYDREVEIEYNTDNKMMIIDILLPIIDDLPNLKKVTYIKVRKEFKESFQTEAYMKKKYDNVIYQIVLLILNIIFKLDEDKGFISSITLNGKVSTIEKATGQEIEPYILSVNVSKDDFNKINLHAVDPKAWFKSARGISAATFANVTPIAPVVNISHEDNRFVNGYEVANQLDETINLAAMDWQDFENLIRELFEQEFNVNGGEVKITQASRDGGVDAVAFDPDPIRGGKIVIQAKRYTNVVGVSAVRDLYGTLMNEGATKGILVTTSNFGNDAYNFAKGKPLTLMNGANLLFLLEKHGHKAKIDLKEAKEMLKGEESN